MGAELGLGSGIVFGVEAVRKGPFHVSAARIGRRVVETGAVVKAPLFCLFPLAATGQELLDCRREW